MSNESKDKISEALDLIANDLADRTIVMHGKLDPTLATAAGEFLLGYRRERDQRRHEAELRAKVSP